MKGRDVQLMFRLSHRVHKFSTKHFASSHILAEWSSVKRYLSSTNTLIITSRKHAVFRGGGIDECTSWNLKGISYEHDSIY